MQVSESIYDLMGSEASSTQKMQFVDNVFTKMDMNGDGVVTKEEFMNYCSTTNNVMQSMGYLP